MPFLLLNQQRQCTEQNRLTSLAKKSCHTQTRTLVCQYQKDKTNINLDFLVQETVNGSGISWAICKSAARLRQMTTPAPCYSVFYRPDALPAAQPIASKQ